jgi:hypothetical protein
VEDGGLQVSSHISFSNGVETSLVYTTYANVQMILRTDLATASITEVITWTDAEVDSLLGGTSAASADKERWSTYLAAAIIAERDPSAQQVGDARGDYGSRAENWRRLVRSEIDQVKRMNTTARG